MIATPIGTPYGISQQTKRTLLNCKTVALIAQLGEAQPAFTR